MKSLPGLRSDYTVSKIRAEMRRKHPHAPRTIGLVLAQLRGLFELKGEKGKCDMHLPKRNPKLFSRTMALPSLGFPMGPWWHARARAATDANHALPPYCT